MSRPPRQLPESDDVPPQPRQMPDVETPSYPKVLADGWMIEGMMQIQKSLGELNATVASLKVASDKQGKTVDRISHVLFAAAVVIAIVLTIGGFIINKTWDILLGMLKAAT